MALQYFATATTVIDGVRYTAGDEVPASPRVVKEIQRGTVVPVPRMLSDIEAAIRDTASSTSEKLFSAGFAFVAGNRKALGSSEIGWWRLTNPSGSGHILYVNRFALYAVSDTLEVSFYLGVGTAGTALVPFQLNQSNIQTVIGNPEHGVGAPGGTQLELSGQASPDQPYMFGDIGKIVSALGPGQSLAASVKAPGGLTGSTIATGSVAWLAGPIPTQ